MTDDRAELMRAVAADPGDDTVRLVFSDFLDESGAEDDAAWAKLIRAQVADPAADPVVIQRYHRGWAGWTSRVDTGSRGYLSAMTPREIRLALRAAAPPGRFRNEGVLSLGVGRGFLSAVRYRREAAFLENAAGVVRDYPIAHFADMVWDCLSRGFFAAGGSYHFHGVGERLTKLLDQIVGLELLLGIPADLSPDEKLPATGQDAVGIAFGSRPAGRLNSFMHGSLFHESQWWWYADDASACLSRSRPMISFCTSVAPS